MIEDSKQIKNLKYLPIGTIIVSSKSLKPLIIIGYNIKIDGNYFDYCALTAPEGFINVEYTFGINHNDINKIISIGYKTDLYEKLNAEMKCEI